MEFNPQIISFLHKWCSNTGADLAGTSRKEPTEINRVIEDLVDPAGTFYRFSRPFSYLRRKQS